MYTWKTKEYISPLKLNNLENKIEKNDLEKEEEENKISKINHEPQNSDDFPTAKAVYDLFNDIFNTEEIKIEESTMKDIANAIRSKTDKTETLYPEEMAEEIINIDNDYSITNNTLSLFLKSPMQE